MDPFSINELYIKTLEQQKTELEYQLAQQKHKYDLLNAEYNYYCRKLLEENKSLHEYITAIKK